MVKHQPGNTRRARKKDKEVLVTDFAPAEPDLVPLESLRTTKAHLVALAKGADRVRQEKEKEKQNEEPAKKDSPKA